MISLQLLFYFCNFSLEWNEGTDARRAGVDLSQLQSQYWNRYRFAPSGDDVILRWGAADTSML